MPTHRTRPERRGHREIIGGATVRLHGDKIPGPEPDDRKGTQRTPIVDTLEVPCWCGRRYLKVPQADVRRGLTASCGREGCSPSP